MPEHDHAIDDLSEVLEIAGSAKIPIIIFDPDKVTDDTANEVEELRHAMEGRLATITPVPTRYLRDLFIFPSPDELERYGAGLPIVIAAVFREPRDPNPTHRPVDTEVVKRAKNALAVETFRLTGRQQAVEVQRNCRRLALTVNEAVERAKGRIAEAVWRGGKDAGGGLKNRHLAGLIDRGRRLAAGFFGTRKPIDRWRQEARDVQVRFATEGRQVLPVIEADNQARARAMSWNEERARNFSAAMAGWNASVANDMPIEHVDGIEVTNSWATRMDAPSLVKVAISGEFDPSKVHTNLLLERAKFEVGVLLGKLERGRPIEVTPDHAAILRAAITTVQRGQLATDADHCDHLLVESAARSRDLNFWEVLLNRVLVTGVTEPLEPKNFGA
jgi:hypothetical protein